MRKLRRPLTRQSWHITVPAIGLIVVAALALLVNGGLLIARIIDHQSKGVPRPRGMSDERFKNYKRGYEAASPICCCLGGVPTMSIYFLVMWGGIQMSRRRSHGLAMVASFLAMLPCSPVFLIGLPLGIWAMMVLRDPAVKIGFHHD